MTRTPPVRRLVAAVAIAATIPLVAACSSGPGSGSAGAGASASSAPAAPSPASSTDATTKTVAPADAAYCTALKSGRQELQSISGKVSDKAALEQGRVVLRKIEAVAPAEVKAAWGDFVAFVEAAASGDKKAVASATAKMVPAGMKIQQHAEATCGFGIS